MLLNLTQMENQKIKNITIKLIDGIRFGLYDSGSTCYFEDGTRVNYHDLWKAIRLLNNLEIGHKKTLYELYPNTFLGTSSRNFSKLRLTRKFVGVFFGFIFM